MHIARQPRTRGTFVLAVLALTWPLVGSAQAQWVWRDAAGHTVFSDAPPPPDISPSSILRQPAASIESGGSRTGNASGEPAGPIYDTSGQAPLAAQPAPNGAARPATANAPGKPAAAPPKKTLAEQDADFRKRQEEHAKAERKAADEEQKTAQRSASCEQAKSYQQMLQDGTRLMRPDAQGNRNFLDDDQRATELQKTQETIATDC